MKFITLWDSVIKKEYSVERILLDNLIARRLEALGITEGTCIIPLTRKKSGAMIVKVRGTRLALGKNITSNIELSEVQNG